MLRPVVSERFDSLQIYLFYFRIPKKITDQVGNDGLWIAGQAGNDDLWIWPGRFTDGRFMV